MVRTMYLKNPLASTVNRISGPFFVISVDKIVLTGWRNRFEENPEKSCSPRKRGAAFLIEGTSSGEVQ